MGVTHSSEDPTVPPVLIASKLEENHPTVDFPDLDNASHLLSCPQSSEETDPLMRCLEDHVNQVTS